MRRFTRFLLLLLAASPLLLNAQAEAPSVTLETPYDAVYVHLYYLQSDSYEPGKAAQALNGSQDSLKKVKLANKLKQVFDGKGLYIRLNWIPQKADYIDSTTMQAVFTPFPNELPEVYLEKEEGRWYYSEETVNSIEELHEEVYPFGADLLLNLVPVFGQREVLGLKAWQFIGLLIILLGAIGLHFVLSRVLRPVVRRLSRYSKIYPSLVPAKLVWAIARLLSVLVVLWLIKLFLPPLQLPIEASNFAAMVIRLTSIVLLAGVLLRVLDIILLYVGQATQRTESKMDDQLLPVIERGVQFLIIAGAIIQALRFFQVDITTLIAGISIGGLAIALAAQDTIKNLFGSVTIFMDKPFQIGDWINFAGVDGTVEEVGFRSTRVRTFANSLVYVPNGKLADMVVDNFGLRRYRRFYTTIAVTYDTPPELIEHFVEGLKEIIAAHPDTRKDFYSVRLSALGAHSLDIVFYSFFDVPDWSSEVKARHEVILEILKLAKALGVRFAFPTQTMHVEEFPGTTPTTPHYPTSTQEISERMEAYAAHSKFK